MGPGFMSRCSVENDADRVTAPRKDAANAVPAEFTRYLPRVPCIGRIVEPRK